MVDCPKTAIGVWKRQAAIHLNVPYIFLEPGDPHLPFNGIVFLAVNFEQTWREKTAALITEFDPHVFIVDESHRIASHKSRQSVAAWHLAKNAEYRWAATGTPSDADEVDLWAQFRFINDALFGNDWKSFERRWLRKAGYGFFKRKIKKHKRKEFLDKVAPYTFVITRKEALDLPPEQDYVIPFQLTGEAKRVYRELENNLMVEIANEVIVTPMAMTLAIKLQQVTGGFLPTDDAIIRLEQNKLATVQDWLEDYHVGTKLVIFARFSEEIKALNWMLSKRRSVGVLEGATKDRTIWERFQDKRDPAVLICQERAGGESIECSVADIGIFYSRSFSYRQYDQCRARLLGRRKKVMFIHPAAENTIDVDLITAVDKKGKTAKDILSELRKRRRNG